MALDENGLRATLMRRAQRHGRVDAELARGVRGRRNHAALVRPPTYHHRFTLERRVVQLFHRYEEGFHIDVEERLSNLAIDSLRSHTGAGLWWGRGVPRPRPRSARWEA